MAGHPDWVVVFDLDGTLTPKSYGSLITLVDHALTKGAALKAAEGLRKKYLARAIAGRLPYKDQAEWMRETVEVFVQEGLNLDSIDEALKSATLRSGARECLKRLADEEIPVAVVSYGIAQFIDSTLRANRARQFVDRIYATDLKIDGQREIIGFERKTLVLPANKDRWSRAFADLRKVDHERILAVGDSGGDENLGHLKRNRLLIAADRTEERKLAHLGTAIITEDFAPVTGWLFEKMKNPA